MSRDLADRWAALLRDCEVDSAMAAPHWNTLASAYGGADRTYHDARHLEHVFAELDGVPLRAAAVEWATWYHDAVYRPGHRDNESKSAELASGALEALGLRRLAPRVVQLILATRLHGAEADDTEALLFLDADMAILGAAPGTYLEYAKDVRREHRAIPGFLFARGRRAFLTEALERPSIFATPHFQGLYEQQARENLEAELTALDPRRGAPWPAGRCRRR
jgi:predicted metal-dependent HD superfamily phosphohydrolase